MSIFWGSKGHDNIKGGNGNDWIFGGNGRDTLNGGNGRDFIYGQNGRDIIYGGPGNDFLRGGNGKDTLYGGPGIDDLYGDKGKDTAVFTLAKNTDNVGHGSEYYDGGRGKDTLRLEFTAAEWSRGDIQQDVLAFVDKLENGPQSGTFHFGTLNLTVKSFETLIVLVNGDEIDPTVPYVFVVDVSDSTEDEIITPPGDANTDIKSGSGNDTIVAGDGKNVIDAGDGDNAVTTGSEDDSVAAGTGNDAISVGDGDNTVEAGDGNDTIVSGSGNDSIIGGPGNDLIESGAGNDTVAIGDGDDVVYAGAGDDVVIAGNGGGNDVINGGPGIDTVVFDSIRTGLTIDMRQQDRSIQLLLNPSDSKVSPGTNLYTIGAILADTEDRDAPGTFYAATLAVGFAEGADIGTDVLIDIENVSGGAGNDIIFGNEGSNRILGFGGDVQVFIDDPSLQDADEIYGGGSTDEIEGGWGNDTLNGEDGDDFLQGGAGNDEILGGAGLDTMIFGGDSTDYEFVNLGAGWYQITDIGGNGDGTDTFKSVENLVFDDLTLFSYQLPGSGTIFGTAGDEILYGTDGNDSFEALGGNDTIYGYDGHDYIVAGAGNDEIYGGDGYDSIDYSHFGTQGIAADMSTWTIIDQFGDTDTVFEVESFNGTDNDDVFYTSVEGQRFYALGGNDSFVGNIGHDTLSYDFGQSSFRGIEVVFSNTALGNGVTEVDTVGDRDVFSSVETLTASDFNDILLGGIGSQNFYDGEGSSDLIDGGSGFDGLDLSGTGSVYLDMENFVTEAEVLGFVGGLATLDVETAARLGSDLTGFFSYTDGTGNTDLGRSIEHVFLFRGGGRYSSRRQ